MGRSIGYGAVLGAALMALAGIQQANAGDLKVSLKGVRSAKGHVMIAIFDDPATFRKAGKEVAAIRLKARAGDLDFTLNAVPAGDYTVTLYHDENANQKLDTNMLGIPSEGYGFSNDARGSFGPPSYDAARITVNSGLLTAPITIRY